MASKVNTRFVVILACVMFILFGTVAVFAAYMVTRSGERYIKKGDAFLAEGKVKEASAQYERAVGKKGGRANAVWLTKWRDTLVQLTPEDPLSYQKSHVFYVNILQALAELTPTDVDRQTEYLTERASQVKIGGVSREDAEYLIEEITRRTEQLDPENPKTKKLIGIRGLAQLDRMRVFTVTPEERQQALKDLEGAAAADINNWECNIGVANWYYLNAVEADRDSRKTEKSELEAKGEEILNQYLAKNPNQPEAMLMAFNIRRLAAYNKAPTISSRRSAMAPLVPEAEKLMDKLLTLDAKEIRPNLLYSIRSAVVFDASLYPKYVKLAEYALSARPKDPELLLTMGEAKELQGDPDGGIAMYQQVVDLPDVPLSLAGVLLPDFRRLAVAKQVDAALQLYDQATDAETKAKVLERAKTFRNKLASMSDVTNETELKLRDGVLALADGKYEAAVATLSDLRAAGQAENTRVLLPLAEALRRQGNVGEARRIYEKMHEDGIVEPSLLLRLGDLYFISLQDTKKAKTFYEEVLQQDPKNTAAKAQLARIAAIETGGVASDLPAGVDESDPILSLMVRVADLQAKGELDEARKLLEASFEKNPKERRVLQALIQLDMVENKRELALERLRKVLALNPNDTELKNIETFLSIADPKEAELKVLAQQVGATPLQMVLGRYQIYAKHNDLDNAKLAYAEAEKLAPDEPAVIEAGFLLAVSQRDFDRARVLAQRAAEKNIDQLNGLSFQGRLEMAQGKYREAAVSFKKAVDKIPERPESWRWLGQAQCLTGDVTSGVKSYERALAGRPADESIAKDLARTLYSVGRLKEALAVIGPDGIMKYGNFGEETFQMWLELEGQVGDRDLAIEKRRMIFKREPKNEANAVSLARLLIDEQLFEDAHGVVKALRAQQGINPLLIVAVEADLLAAQGKGSDGEKLYKDYLASLAEKDRAMQPYSLYSKFLIKQEKFPEAAEVLRSARPYQSKERQEADRQLGDLLFERGVTGSAAAADATESEQAKSFKERSQEFLGQARDAYLTVIEAGADSINDGYAVSKRLAEVYARLDQYDKADAAIQSMIDRTPADKREKLANDREVLLLRSQFAIGAKDRSRAREILDKACDLYPTEHSPFLRRALLNESEPNDAMFADAIADLDKVNQLRPGMIEAWQLRFEMYRKRNKMDDAYTQLRKGIDANPNDNGLKLFLVQQLQRDGKQQDAMGEVVRFARERPEDLEWAKTAGDLCFRQEQWNVSEELWARVYDRERLPIQAAYLLESKLRRTDKKPDKKDVVQLLVKVNDIPNQDMSLLMLRSRANVFLGDTKAAADRAKEAFQECNGDTKLLTRWFNQLTSVVGSLDFGHKLLADLETVGPLPPIILIARFGDKYKTAPVDVQLAELKKIDAMTSPEDKLARLEFCRLAVRLYYTQKMYAQAAEKAKEGLAIFPDDRELNNNLGYLLVKHLDNPSEALPYAKAAAELDATNSAALDTLGVVYLKLDQLREAEQVLVRASQTAKLTEEVLTSNMHLAQTLSKLGDKAGAKRAYEDAQKGFKQSPKELQDLYRPEMDLLEKDLK